MAIVRGARCRLAAVISGRVRCLVGALGNTTAVAMPAMAMSKQVKGKKRDDQNNPRPIAG
jgi:hypothetical protein